MGLWSYFFPSPADRIATARTRMASNRWADARLEVLELDHPDAPGVLLECEQALAQLNLDAAVSWARAGEDARVQHHLQLADTFGDPTMAEAFKEARREMREIRAERTAAQQRELDRDNARLMQADPLGLTGGPSWRDPTLPADLLAEHDDEAAARLALVVEGYPADLRVTVGELGAPFARALLDLEDGRADLAVQGLLTLDDNAPVIRFERARAAYVLKDPAAAIRELRAFAKVHGKHVSMGRHHTGSLLALCHAESGDPAEALRVLRDVRAHEPGLDGGLYAQLLEMNGNLEEARNELVTLIRSYSRDAGLYQMLARVLIGLDQTDKAIQVLERGMDACDCKPGTCGARPPDPGLFRMLATLYLEGRTDVDRGLKLADQAAGMVQQVTWDDAYLHALAADRSGNPEAPRMALGLFENTPPSSPNHAKLTANLPAPR